MPTLHDEDGEAAMVFSLSEVVENSTELYSGIARSMPQSIGLQQTPSSEAAAHLSEPIGNGRLQGTLYCNLNTNSSSSQKDVTLLPLDALTTFQHCSRKNFTTTSNFGGLLNTLHAQTTKDYTINALNSSYNHSIPIDTAAGSSRFCCTTQRLCFTTHTTIVQDHNTMLQEPTARTAERLQATPIQHDGKTIHINGEIASAENPLLTKSESLKLRSYKTLHVLRQVPSSRTSTSTSTTLLAA
eukprot:1804620-Amphidinium_carterae.1